MNLKLFPSYLERIFHICAAAVILLSPVVYPSFLGTSPARALSQPGTGDCSEVGNASCADTGSQSSPGPLPDLQTILPYDLRLGLDELNGTLLLRFSNSIANTGEGPLELRGTINPKTNIIEVSQYFIGEDEVEEKSSVGEFIYEPKHGHYHWEGFSLYEIWSVKPGGNLVEVVISSDKVGFCLLDSQQVDGEWLSENTDRDVTPVFEPGYRECTTQRQGISVGWMDTYKSDIPGQAVDISELPNGIYALRSTANPDGVIHEMSGENNSAVVYFSLNDGVLTVYGDQYPKADPAEQKDRLMEKKNSSMYPILK